MELFKEGFAEVVVEGSGDDYRKTDWVTSAYYEHLNIRRYRKNGKRIGTVTVILRLCGTEDPAQTAPNWPWLDQSCLIIGWHKTNDYWEAEHFEPSSADSIRHVASGLWAWRGEVDGDDDAHFFVLPVFALKSETDLRRFAIKPLQAMFAADDGFGDVAEAALAGVPVLVPGAA